MKRKTMLLVATALSAMAFAALPSMVSAFETTPAITPVEGAEFPLAYTATGGMTTLYTAGRKIFCESTTSEGSITNAHTGSGKTAAHGCKESTLGSKCTSPGQESATIMTQTLTAHTVYLKPTNPENPHETPGGVVTPNETTGTFAEFSCAGGLVKIVIKGNGLLGTAIEPVIGGEASNSGKGNVSATEAGQQHTETVEGEKFGLEVSVNGGAFAPAYLNSGTETATLSGGAKAKTTTGTP